MTDSNAPGAGLNWFEAQQRYIEALAALGGGGQASASGNPWRQALDYWWQGARSAIPARDRGVFEQLLAQMQCIYALSEQFGGLMRDMASRQDPATGWESVLDRHIETMKSAAAGFQDPGLFGPLASWQLPADTWQRAMSFFSALPGRPPATQGGPGSGVLPGWPGEFQAEIQDGARLWEAYRQALQEYQSGLAKVSANALERLRRKLVDLGRGDGKVDSLRGLYDLWIDASEEAWAEHAYSDDYARVFGSLVNALMAFRRHGQGLVEKALAAMNMPTRGEVDGIEARQQDMRRDLRETAERGAENARTLERLIGELESLRRHLNGDGEGKA